jgi:hypothetical protein
MQCHAHSCPPIASNEPLEKTVEDLNALYAPAAWVEDRELRHLRAEERRLEQELQNLGGTSSAAKPTSGKHVARSNLIHCALVETGGASEVPCIPLARRDFFLLCSDV